MPVALAAGVCGVIALLFFSLGGNINGMLKNLSETYQHRIDRADMSVKAEDFVLIVLGAGALLWVALVLIIRTELLVGLILAPLCLAVSVVVSTAYLKFRGDQRVNNFMQQLELVLRMLSGALRVGLGLRQAVILVTEEVPDPAQREFMRVVGRTNLGISIIDALDELALTMPGNEMQMFARTVRVQQQTGGDLAKVLETLAGTIRDRRRVHRKMKSLTAQGRFAAFIIGTLPILVGGFVVITQPQMSDPLLHTRPGLIALGLVAVLEGLAIFSLSRILRFDV